MEAFGQLQPSSYLEVILFFLGLLVLSVCACFTNMYMHTQTHMYKLIYAACMYVLSNLLMLDILGNSGLAFMLSHERVALLITTGYSVYCAWMYVGWLWLLLALNLSFISSDVLIYYLKNHMSHHRRSNGSPEERAGMQGQPAFSSNEPTHASSSEYGPGPTTDRSAGVPSTSEADFEITSDQEVVRLLNCSDYYAVLGLTRYQSIDVSLLKREYRKKVFTSL